MKKHKHFKFVGFLNILGETEIHTYNSQNMGKVNSRNTGKVWENTEISHILHYLADLELMGTHAIPNAWERTNSHKMEILSLYCQIIPRLWFFEEIRSYYETQIIHIVWVM